MPTMAVPKIAIKPIFRNNSIFLLCNPYLLQTRDKTNKDGTYETSPIVKESTKNPNNIAAKIAFQVESLSENGNNKITGQHGLIPFIFSQLGDKITLDCKQIKVKKISNVLLSLAIIFKYLYPIYCFW